MADLVDALFAEGLEPQAEAPTPEPVQEPAQEPAPVAPAPAPEPQAEPIAPEPKDERSSAHVPVTALLDEREKRQAAERERDRLLSQVKPPESPQRPDPYDDPEGFARHVENLVQAKTTESRFELSEELAISAHGKEAVDAAGQWALEKAKANPAWANEYMTQRHPFEWIVRQHKRDGLLSQIGDVNSVDDWFAQEAAKRGYQPTAPIAAVPGAIPIAASMQPAVKPAAPPRSIASDASAPAASGDPTADFMAIFNRK